jgi:hypothetical protein
MAKNVETKVDKNKLIITVDLSKDFGLSKSGKNTTIATTEGNMSVDGKPEIKFGLNVYTAPKTK